MRRVRLMTWCPNAVSGMHLPAFAAEQGGLFAEQGLEVELVAPAKARDSSLSGLTATVKAVADGVADFALTAVVYLLAAQTEAAGRLPVRFIAVAHQRNPIAGVVREDSGMRAPEDLPGTRAARWSPPWYADDYAGALSWMGLEPPVIVDTPGGLDAALGSGAVDVLPMWMDDAARARMQGMVLYHRGAGFAIRTVPLAIPVYTTGLVAADRLPAEVIRAMRDAFAAGYDLQRTHPEPGLAAFGRHFAGVPDEHVRNSWATLEPYAFDGAAPGSMDAGRWRDTIAHIAAIHGLSLLPGERLYRPELLARPRAPASDVGADRGGAAPLTPPARDARADRQLT